MQVSNQTDSYQMINMYQMANTQKSGAVILPIVPEPKVEMGAKDVYEASHGNLISSKDGTLSLTPEGELNVSNAKEANLAEEAATAQAKKDEQRDNVVDYIGYQSKKSQVEIYLSVASDSEDSLGNNDTISIIESLRDVQKQNNIVEAYATYAQNQKGGDVTFY
jgi:hypothetical protein